MTSAERRSFAVAKFLEAIAYREDAATVRHWLKKLMAEAPKRQPLVIWTAADGTGLTPHDSNGGSSKRPHCTERQVRAALAAHADLIPADLTGHVEVRAYEGGRQSWRP